MPIAIFGEKVLYKPLDVQKDKSKIDAQWESGIWLGIARESNEALVGTSSGVTRAYAIKRRATDERWDGDAITTMMGTPQRPNPEKAGLHIPTRIAPKVGDPGSGVAPGGVAPGENEGIPEAMPIPDPLTRRMPITHKEIEKYGYTDGCPGCDAKKRGEVARRGHSEKCRRRIEEALRNDEEGKEDGKDR